MQKNELFSQFTQQSEIIRTQIEIISASLTEEKLPDESAVREVMVGIEDLRSIHQQIREYAASILPADEIPAGDASISDFRTAIERSLAFQIRLKIDRIEDIFQKFLSVYSDDPDYSAELKTYQVKTSVLLAELRETQRISEEMELLVESYAAFLSLLQMPDRSSDEWDSVYEPLEDSGIFSGKVLRGLRKSKYTLTDRIETIGEEKEEELQPADGSIEKTEPEIQTIMGNETDSEQSDSMEELFLSPRNPIKNKTVTTGSFLKTIKAYNDPLDLAIFLPLIWRLGPTSISILSAVWDVFAYHSPLYRFANKYLSKHPKESDKNNEKEEKQSGNARKQAEYDLLRILNYLEKENILSVYELPEDSGSIFCLTPYAYECMCKEKIKTYRIPVKGPLQNKPFWADFFRCTRKFTASEKISVENLLNVCGENKSLLTYVALVLCQKNHDNSVLQFMNDIKWDGKHYHVNVFLDDKVYPCVMVNDPDEISNEYSNIILCAPDTDVILSQDYQVNGELFLFAFDQMALYEMVGNDWKEVFILPHKNKGKETQELLNENETECSSDRKTDKEEFAIPAKDKQLQNDDNSENFAAVGIDTGESDHIVNEVENVPETSNETIETSNNANPAVSEDKNLTEISNETIETTDNSVLALWDDKSEIAGADPDAENQPVISSGTETPTQSGEADSEGFEREILLSLIEPRLGVPEDADFDSLSASDMAMYLYENNIDPAPAANHEFFYRLVYQLIAEKNLYNAVLMAHALSALDDQPDYMDFFKLVEAGCDIAPFTAKYTGTELQNLTNIFDRRNYRIEDYVILISAAVRGLFCPDNETGRTDYQLKNLAEQLAELDLFAARKTSGYIRNLINSLSEMIVTIPDGFTDDVLNLFKKTGSKEKLEAELSKQAEILMKLPSNMVQMRDLSLFIRDHFGPKSKIHKMLSFVQQKNYAKSDEVSFFLEEYYDQYKDFTEDNIKQYIQDLWRSSVGAGFRLQFHGLNNIVRAFTERFTLLERWCHLTSVDKNPMPDQKKETAMKTRSAVLDSVRQINADLSEDPMSAPTTTFVLSHMLSTIYGMLQTDESSMGSEITKDWYQTYFLIFDESGTPICDQGLNQILYCEPWRIVLRHLLTEKISPEDAVRRIYDDDSDSYWGDNYGLAKWLIESNNLSLHHGSAPKDLDRAYFTVYFSEHFEKILEMDVFHDRITESQKDDLIEAEKTFRHYFRDNENYGQYRYFLKCLLQRTEMECQYLTIGKIAELNQLSEDKKIERKEDVDKIRRLILERNFTAADDKLKRLQDNEYDLWMEDDGKSYFDHFLSVYDDIYRALKDNKGVEVGTFYGSVLGKNKNWEMEFSNAYQKSRKSRRNIFPNWGKENENAVKTLFEELDFPVKNVKKDNEFFVLTVEPSQQNLPEYPHPIAKFGTRMSEKIRVIYKKGVVTANSINDISKKNSIGGTGIIILADYAIPLDDRRKIVEDFMSSDKEYPFIVIDRVLLFYLAAQVEVDRKQVLLECTLPFSYTQPYVDGKGDVPDEMFFGRHTELTKIRLGSSACLVYGGRQLGKTALLKRTANLENKPDEKQFAVYFDVKDNNVEKTVSQIVRKLNKLNIIPNQPKNMEDLCNSIERKLSEGRSVKRLLLLIDEADAYLSDDGENAYEATKKLLDLHREYPQNFKFVFAGLHNVARTARGSKNNSLIGQFNMVPIGQLSKQDAEQLIQKPLRYLGFRMEDEQIASIIENANYYPGVLQYFCYKMLEEVYSNYRSHFSALKKNPPFVIREENLKKIISKANLSREIKHRLSLTLELDDRYMFFANLIAYLYYEDRESGNPNPYGYSLRTIKENGAIFAPELDDYDYEPILEEMVEMGILTKEKANYKLRRAGFLEMINDEESVKEYLDSEPFLQEEVKDE